MQKKIVFVQPALPSYRIDFFNRLYNDCRYDITVYYALSDLNVRDADKFVWATCSGKLTKLFYGFFLQAGINPRIRNGDVMVLSGNVRNLSVWRLFFLSKLRGASVVWWGHYVSAGGGRFGLLIRIFFMLFSDALVFYVDSEIHRFRNSLRFYRFVPKVYALNNGLDISDIVELRDDYVSSKRDIDFIFIGRLTGKASFDILLEALNRNCDGSTLHVVGGGALEAFYIEKANKMGLSSRITWHGALGDEQSISVLMNRSKVFVYAGGVGLSLIHAMAYGLPAILHSSISQHMPEFDAFENDVTGFSFEFNNASSLGETMRFALSDLSKLNQMSRNAISKIGPNFTTEGMVQRFRKLIDGL